MLGSLDQAADSMMGLAKQKTRIDLPVVLARNVKASNEIINLNFDNVEYHLFMLFKIQRQTDKFTFHVHFNMAAKYLSKQ
jgi:hypothetical protein